MTAPPPAAASRANAWAKLKLPSRHGGGAKRAAEQTFSVPLPRAHKSSGVRYTVRSHGSAVASRVAQLTGPHGTYYIAQSDAHGAYGKLRVGLDPSGMPVAVKVLRLKAKEYAQTKVSSLANIVDELNAASHAGPEYCALDVMQVGNKVFIVMPLAGGDLDSLCCPPEGRQALRAHESAWLARHTLAQTAVGLTRMHKQGWAHLDLKPENLLWYSDGKVRLADFGLASDCQASVGVRGTLHTLAPEMAMGRKIDGRADVWSLGITLCELMSPKAQPFTAKFDSEQRVSRDASLKHVVANHHLFASWHQALPRLRNGDLNMNDLHSADADHPMKGLFATYLAEVFLTDPQLCQFIFRRMLVPNPKERASMQEVLRFAASLPEAKPAQRAKLSQWLRQRAPSAHREATLKVLHEVAGGRGSDAGRL